MADRFPHMNDTDFPGLPDDSNFLDNTFDYRKYDKTQMRIGVCSVPWDVGLIHVGNAQIGGLGNVVYFESKEARDAYFDDIGGYVFDTKYREYHSDGSIQIPLPYEKAVLFNYVWVEYTRLPTEYSEYGKDRFFFFIRECESLSPNDSKVTILRDTWQTFVYDIDISYMMLEQGHAPMSIIDADTYLANPIENNSWLLADDVNFGNSYKRKYHNSIVLNTEDIKAVIVTTANLLGNWNDKTPDGHVAVDGNPSYYAYALEPGSLAAFLSAVDAQCPQFSQTVQGVFFVSARLVRLLNTVTFCGYELTRLEQKTSNISLADLTKAAFGYGEDYANLAKLYTYPYAFLEIANDSGDVTQIKIEETSGNLSLIVTTSLAYPWIAIDGRLTGVGEGSASIEFYNVDAHTFDFQGSWYDHLHRWEVPIFGITQSAAIVDAYSHKFEREQKERELDTALGNATRSANTSYDNAVNSARTAFTNAVASADTGKLNADAADNTSYANTVASADTGKTNADAVDNTAYSNAVASADTAKTTSDNSANTQYDNAINSATAKRDNSMDNAQTAKDVSYRNALTTKRNADASNFTRAQNAYDTAGVVKQNADNTASTAYTNASNSASVTKANADMTAETNKSNSYDIASVDKETRDRSAQSVLTNTQTLNTAVSLNAGDTRGTATINALNAESYAKRKINRLSDKMDGDVYHDIAASAMQAALTADLNLATMMLNQGGDAISSVANGALTGAFSGAATGAAAGPIGALAGAAIAGVGSAASATMSAASYALVVTNSQQELDHSEFHMKEKTRIQKEYNSDITDIEHEFNQVQVSANNTLNQATTDRSVSASNTAAEHTRDVEYQNSDATKSNAETCADRIYNTAIAANANIYNMEMDNADNDKQTAMDNSGNIKDTTDGNVRRDWETGRDNNSRTYDAAISNADDVYDNASVVANRDYNTDSGNALRTKNTSLDNNRTVRNTAVANAERSRDTGLQSNSRTRNTAVANAERSRDTGLQSNSRTRNTSVANATRTRDASIENALRSKNTDLENAQDSYDTGIAGIQADIDQAALGAPVKYGEFSNGETSATRPQGLFCNIVTQSKDAIEQTGDYWLRFGYKVNRSWKFTGFNLMPHFTYWKASDMWIAGNNVPDAYLDEIRFYLLGGVCVWRNPDDIGRISIYDNMG